MANKKIVVLKFRELVYTGIFLFFGIVLILLLVVMFSGKDSDTTTNDTQSSETPNTSASEPAAPTSAASLPSSSDSLTSLDQESLLQNLAPGLYTTDIKLADNTFTLQLLVDADRITEVELLSQQETVSGTDAGEYVATMYPLVEPALEIIERSLSEGIPLSEITFSVENQYTGSLLVQAIEQLLQKALPAAE